MNARTLAALALMACAPAVAASRDTVTVAEPLPAAPDTAAPESLAVKPDSVKAARDSIVLHDVTIYHLVAVIPDIGRVDWYDAQDVQNDSAGGVVFTRRSLCLDDTPGGGGGCPENSVIPANSLRLAEAIGVYRHYDVHGVSKPSFRKWYAQQFGHPFTNRP